MTQPTFSSFTLPPAGHSAASQEARLALLTERARSGAARPAGGASLKGARVDAREAIANAARSTSVAFDYLMAQAQVESAMNPKAKSNASSATGLYQFIESTWLETIKRHGPRFGMGDIADQISLSRRGRAHVADPATRAAILELRNDPEIASLMAAGLAEDNRAHLMPILGRQPDANELYLAHFLGAGGAGRFLSAMQSDPDTSAAALFRRPAAANRAVFFGPNGRPRSLAGVMNVLGTKIDRAMALAPTDPSGKKEGFAQRVADFSTRNPSGDRYEGRAIGVPYLIAAEEVFGPKDPPIIAGGARPATPRIASFPTLSVPGAPLSPAPTGRSRSMSDLLETSLEANGVGNLASPDTALRVRRAYERLRAMGL